MFEVADPLFRQLFANLGCKYERRMDQKVIKTN